MRLHSVLQLIIREATASLRLQVDDVRCRSSNSMSAWSAALLHPARHYHNALHNNCTFFTVVAACHIYHAAAPNAVVTNDDLFSGFQQVGDAGLHAVVTCTLMCQAAGPK